MSATGLPAPLIGELLGNALPGMAWFGGLGFSHGRHLYRHRRGRLVAHAPLVAVPCGGVAAGGRQRPPLTAGFDALAALARRYRRGSCGERLQPSLISPSGRGLTMNPYE